ncbi:hypothetical protein C0J52_22593, partial [Blattella germanica]
INFQNFSKWVQEKLLPNLPPNCLIVLDIVYHSVQTNKPPTLASRKSEIQGWLNTNGTHFEEDMRKAELIHMLRAECPTSKYFIDSLFHKHGHETIRLPPYHCDLNAIEYIWNITKTQVAQRNVTQSAAQIDSIMTQVVQNVTEKDWKKVIAKVKTIIKNTGNKIVWWKKKLNK